MTLYRERRTTRRPVTAPLSVLLSQLPASASIISAHIHLQNIRMHDAHVRLAGETVAQERDQPVVQLDGDHPAGLLGDQLGSTPGPGPTSRTVSSRVNLAAATIRARWAGSTRKFWPKPFWGGCRGRRVGRGGSWKPCSDPPLGWKPAAGPPRGDPHLFEDGRCARDQAGTGRLEEVRLAAVARPSGLPMFTPSRSAHVVAPCALEPRDDFPGQCVGALLCRRVRDGCAIFEAQRHQRAGDRAAGAAGARPIPPPKAADTRSAASASSPSSGANAARTDGSN